MALDPDVVHALVQEIADRCSRKIDVDVQAKSWMTYFRDWTDADLAKATERWQVKNSGQLWKTFPPPAHIGKFKPERRIGPSASREKRLKCSCDGGGGWTTHAELPAERLSDNGRAGERIFHSTQGPAIVIPCWRCNGYRFEVWHYEATGRDWDGKKPAWAA